MTSTEMAARKPNPEVPDAEFAGVRILRQIFEASLAPFAMAAHMRKHFRIGHHFWTLNVAAA